MKEDDLNIQKMEMEILKAHKDSKMPE